ncbi:YjcG family protein [Heyndrickxia sporothermodurans]|uniref:Putative phosphoesterase JGZ69_13940 n=2 Tax=Heyndrickxia sporothermodurans TaxID=46224 RepID=A0AB37HG41_9BACI|nr:YjcG family protein [Heyndrickxia sporothermodurans]MBL5768719.1 2'-5' RNA ligase family protein [Heyndrickxia sporothermodurans]MBL5772437.1 2'-5' RNA ligase family protein [Heyndrickxia sporothermodurans]MBL5776134.1 2'-5' RNA ligase family protein [Heyndrickxia sporothermodurans]MBL5779833.1 2'-5' RNA ligase family protein [Heyndrickxia sporothermodurans]MBL5783228.1 2'-5' RNA ligase family protein [Heyndrickxia sporothermodurans]
MKYGIVMFPSKKLQDLVNSYRKRYDPHYALIPPHITLKHVFESSDDEIKTVSRKLNQLSKQHHPMKIHVSKVSTFQPVNNTIYFKVEPTPELEQLNKELYSELPGEEPEYSFVPHITIGQKLSNDEHSDIYGQLSMVGIEHEEVIDRFHLLYQLESGQWTVYETYRLGEE